MRVRIRHETSYTYGAPVQLGRQTLRYRPLSDANQHLLNFNLTIRPEPAGRSELADLDGNHAIAAWFEKPTPGLHIEAVSEVETLRTNPFDYIWQGETELPVRYSPAYQEALGPYRASIVADEVRRLGDDVAAMAGQDAQAFLGVLARVLHEKIQTIVRPDGGPMDARETLKQGEGSCRDLAVLFIAIARAQGFAARFVSGYQTVPAEDGTFDLHAWAEVYAPGGGWRGFDPTAGLAVSDRHVAVAVAALAENAAPVTGTYGGSAESRLQTRVVVEELDGSSAAGPSS